MSVPLAAIFEGDLTIDPGSNTTSFGFGDLKVARRGLFNGTEDTTGLTDGNIINQGGLVNIKAVRFDSTMDVNGHSTLDQVSIDTSDGQTSITGPNAVSISVGASSTFTSTGGNVTLSSTTQSAIVNSGKSASDAIQITSSNGAGGIQVLSGTSSGLVNIGTGSGGFIVGASAGSVNTTSYGASSTFTVASTGAGQDLNISVSGATDSSINMNSSGTGTDAISIITSNSAGGIQMLSGTSSGLVNIGTGSGGFTVGASAGSVNTTSYGASSTFTVASTGAGQDLNISVSGATDSSVNITSSGTGTDAIRLETTSVSGGIYMFAEGRVDIQSTDNVNGINIGTINSGLVNIGKSGSTTTVYGNLNVLGLTTAIESTVLTVDDNVIFINNGPSATSDGGVAIKRWQSANDASSGEVVNPPSNPPGFQSGTAQAGSSTTITLAAGASASDDFYNGWWLKITAGTGASQVRKIKDYNGTTKVASIYTTADQTGVLGSPTPTEGLDFGTAPANDSVYALYPSTYTMMIWDESLEEFAFVYATLDSEQQVTFNSNYADLHIRNLTVDTITATNINNASADLIFNVTLTDNSTSAVTMTGFTLTYGIYVVLIRPDTANTNRPSGIFVIGRINDNGQSGTVSRLISIKGASNSQIGMQWASGGVKPGLRYTADPGVVGTTIYKIRALTI